MISAFGVEHTISKSLVPGAGYSIKHGMKGYKKATQLTGSERSQIKERITTGQGKRIKERGGRIKIAEARDKAGKSRKEIWPGIKTAKGKAVRIGPSDRSLHGVDDSVQAFAQPNGRGGGQIVLFNRSAAHQSRPIDRVVAHERQHILPKRNPVRFQDRYKNPARRGREEGRADFRAEGKQTTGAYPGPPEFQQGYNEVQGKMAAAKFRRNMRRNQ